MIIIIGLIVILLILYAFVYFFGESTLTVLMVVVPILLFDFILQKLGVSQDARGNIFIGIVLIGFVAFTVFIIDARMKTSLDKKLNKEDATNIENELNNITKK